MDSYAVEIWHAWCCWKACQIFSSLFQKEKFEKEPFSSHGLTKHQMTNSWSQGILEVKQCE
jgi:hypothetical protein